LEGEEWGTRKGGKGRWIVVRDRSIVRKRKKKKKKTGNRKMSFFFGRKYSSMKNTREKKKKRACKSGLVLTHCSWRSEKLM